MTSLRVRMSLYGERALWDRPWWSRTSEADVYRRVDGHSVRVVAPAEMIARLDWYDHENPRPAPDRRAGQVWAWPDGSEELTAANRTFKLCECGCGFAAGVNAPIGSWAAPGAPWPPPGAVLVEGVGAPWVPPGWAP